MTEPDDQQWSRRRLRNEAHGADPSRADSGDGQNDDSADGPRATPLSPRGPAEPLSYITQERGGSDGGAFRPRRDDDQPPPTEAIEQVDGPGYRPRDFSPEGRTGVPSWAPAYTQTRNPFASTADQAAQGQADGHGELDYQTARRDEVIPPAAESGVNEPPPITESIPIFNGERTMTRRELRALREARAAEAAKTGVPAPDIFVTSITGLPQERPGEGEPAEAAPVESVDEPAPIDRPATERPAWAPVFTDVSDAVSPASDEPAEADADELAEEETFLAEGAAEADAPAESVESADAAPETGVADDAAAPESTQADEADAAVDLSTDEAETHAAAAESVEPAAPSTSFISAPPQPVELVEPPAPARWSPDAAGEGSVFDQLLSGSDAPAAPAAPSIDELLFGAPTPPPAANEDGADVAPADEAVAVTDESEAVETPEAESLPSDDAASDESSPAAGADTADADAADETAVEREADPNDADAELAAEDAEPAADDAPESVVADDAPAEADDADDAADAEVDETPADEPSAADEIAADEESEPAGDEPQLPSLNDLPPPGAAPAEPNGDPASYLGAAPSVSDRVDMPAPSAWRAPEPPQQVEADDADEIIVEPAPADAPVEAHPVVVDVTPLPAEPLPPVDEPSTATHWSDTDQGAHGDFVASRDVIGGHGVVTTNALVLPSIPQPELAGPLTTTGEIIITGSIDLPRSLSSTGAHPTQLDESALDHELDPGDHQVASTDSQPVRAIRAVSTHTSTRGMMSNPKPRGNRTLTVLIIASASLAVLVAGVLVFSLVTGQF